MKRIVKHAVLILLATVVVVCLFNLRSHRRIYTRQRYTLRTFLNVHESPYRDLVIDGNVYENITGNPPYYIALKRSQKIVFVARPAGRRGPSHLHVYDLDDRSDFTCDFDVSPFGNAIGSPDASYSDKAFFEGNVLVLKCRVLDGWAGYVVDMKNGGVEELDESKSTLDAPIPGR